MTFNTKLDRVVNDITSNCPDILKQADEKDSGFFNITVKRRQNEKTLQQLRAFHSLVHAIWQTGETSYESELDLKNSAKLASSKPAYYVYLEDTFQITVENIEDIPFGCYFVAVPKSMSDFTIAEGQGAIDFLINLIHEAGISSKKIDEIFTGMDSYS